MENERAEDKNIKGEVRREGGREVEKARKRETERQRERGG